MKYYQHGDVLIFEEKEIPEGLEIFDKDFLQAGEHTNHFHRLVGDKRIMFRKGDLDSSGNGEKFFTLNSECKLVHEEHNPIILPPGNYKTKIVREYCHLTEQIRQVQD